MQSRRENITSSRWRDVASVEEKVRSSAVNVDRVRGQTGQNETILAMFKEGIIHLMNRVDKLSGNEDANQLSGIKGNDEGSVLELLNQFSGKLSDIENGDNFKLEAMNKISQFLHSESRISTPGVKAPGVNLPPNFGRKTSFINAPKGSRDRDRSFSQFTLLDKKVSLPAGK